MGVARWKYRAVRVRGRIFPHQGSVHSLILEIVAFATIFALVFLGADALINRHDRQPDRQASPTLPHRPSAPPGKPSAAIAETSFPTGSSALPSQDRGETA